MTNLYHYMTDNYLKLFFFFFLFLLFFPLSSFSNQKSTTSAVVPAGPFIMGSDHGNYDEGPAHTVYVNQFSMDRYEVTNAEYEEFVKTFEKKPARFSKDKRFNKPSHPVVGVTWQDALRYCRWKNKILPTEAQWEKAARGTDSRLYTYGNVFNEKGANILSKTDPFKFTAPVGQFPLGVSPYKIFDLLGNVWEWTLDWYDKDYYKKAVSNNPEGPKEGALKVLRGGSWFNNKEIVKTTKRYKSTPDNRSQTYGFRCVENDGGQLL